MTWSVISPNQAELRIGRTRAAAYRTFGGWRCKVHGRELHAVTLAGLHSKAKATTKGKR